MRPRFVYELQKLRDLLFNVLKLRVVHTLRNFSPHTSDNGAQRAQDRDEIRSDVSDDLGLPLKFSLVTRSETVTRLLMRTSFTDCGGAR